MWMGQGYIFRCCIHAYGQTRILDAVPGSVCEMPWHPYNVFVRRCSSVTVNVPIQEWGKMISGNSLQISCGILNVLMVERHLGSFPNSIMTPADIFSNFISFQLCPRFYYCISQTVLGFWKRGFCPIWSWSEQFIIPLHPLICAHPKGLSPMRTDGMTLSHNPSCPLDQLVPIFHRVQFWIII